MADLKNVNVKLKTKSKESKNQSFPLETANKLLKLPNSQWELDDKDFKWNGTELAKASTAKDAKA